MHIDHADLKPLANIEGQTCFGCGETNPMGLKMRFQTDGRKIVSQLSVPAHLTGWDTIVHGGIISTILDEVMGWTVIGLLGKIGVTKTMTVEFLRPVQAEQLLTVIGTVAEVQSGRQVIVNGEIYSGQGVLSARATGHFAALEAQTAVRLGIMSAAYMERFLPILQQAQGVEPDR